MERRKKLVDHTGKILGLHKVMQFLGYEDDSSRQLYLCEDIYGNTAIFKSKTIREANCGTELRNKNSVYLNRLLSANHKQMISRCYDSYCKAYKAYGERGIRICSEWLGDKGFFNFRSWALASGWKKGLTIDRKDVNGNYTPENCRFITRQENARYKRTTVLSCEIAEDIRNKFKFTQLGKYAFCRETAKKYNVNIETIRAVINSKTWV